MEIVELYLVGLLENLGFMLSAVFSVCVLILAIFPNCGKWEIMTIEAIKEATRDLRKVIEDVKGNEEFEKQMYFAEHRLSVYESIL